MEILVKKINDLAWQYVSPYKFYPEDFEKALSEFLEAEKIEIKCTVKEIVILADMFINPYAQYNKKFCKSLNELLKTGNVDIGKVAKEMMSKIKRNILNDSVK